MTILRALLLLLLTAATASAQITLPYPAFSTPNILRAEVEANDAELASLSLNRTGGTMTGALSGTAITLSSTLTVGGATTLSSTLAVSGASTLAATTVGNLTLTGTTLPSVTNVRDLGSSTFRFDDVFARAFDITLNAVIGGTLSVTGAQTFIGNTDMRGSVADSTGNLTLGDAVDITGTLALTGSLSDPDSAVTIADTLDVTTFGTSTFTAGGTGMQQVTIRNTTSGTANGAQLAVGANAYFGYVKLLSTAFTASGPNQPDAMVIETDAIGGLSIASTNASTHIRFYSQGTSEQARVTNSGLMSKRTTTMLGISGLNLTGNIGSFSSTGTGLYLLFDDTAASEDGFAIVGDNGDELRFMDYTAGTGTVRLTMQGSGILRAVSGTAAAPTYSFTADTDTGLYSTGGGQLGVAVDGVAAMMMDSNGASDGIITVFRDGSTAIQLDAGNQKISLDSFALGTGPIIGGGLYAGRNTSGGGAAGFVGLVEGDGTATQHVWPDNTGLLRISTSAPEEDGTPAHNSGTVVGDQTSVRSAKTIIRQRTDYSAMLREVLRAPLFEFTYKDGRYNRERFTGVTTTDSPVFGKDQGKALNEVTAIGYLMGSIRELEARLAKVERKLP